GQRCPLDVVPVPPCGYRTFRDEDIRPPFATATGSARDLSLTGRSRCRAQLLRCRSAARFAMISATVSLRSPADSPASSRWRRPEAAPSGTPGPEADTCDEAAGVAAALRPISASAVPGRAVP